MPIGGGGSGSGGGGSVIIASTVGDNSGDKTTTSGSFVDSGISLAISATAGDNIIASLTAAWSDSGATTARKCYFQLIAPSTTVIAGVIYNCPATSGLVVPLTLTQNYAVVSGDISGGTITVKLQFAVDGGDTLSVKNSGFNNYKFSLTNLHH